MASEAVEDSRDTKDWKSNISPVLSEDLVAHALHGKSHVKILAQFSALDLRPSLIHKVTFMLLVQQNDSPPRKTKKQKTNKNNRAQVQ